LGAVALMALLHLWTNDQLAHTHTALQRMSPMPPAKTTAHDAVAVEMSTTPLSLRHSLEMTVSAAGT
jgi:hypothetical protein